MGRHLSEEVDFDEEDALGKLQAQSVQRPLPFAEGAPSSGRFTAFLRGFSMHAGVRIAAHDKAGRERLCGYGARGPIALKRLRRANDGRYHYKMKRTLRDGTRWLVLDGVELLQRIATLVPPKRQNLTRYHGVFASNSKLRALVIPQKVKPVIDLPLCPRPKGGPWRTDWAELLRRVFAVDVLSCARCGGRMRLIAFIKKKSAAQKILRHLKLPSQPLAAAPARAPPQEAREFEAA
jgi:hypothetical protein